MRQGKTIRQTYSRRALFETTKSGNTGGNEKEEKIDEDGKY